MGKEIVKDMIIRKGNQHGNLAILACQHLCDRRHQPINVRFIVCADGDLVGDRVSRPNHNIIVCDLIFLIEHGQDALLQGSQFLQNRVRSIDLQGNIGTAFVNNMDDQIRGTDLFQRPFE